MLKVEPMKNRNIDQALAIQISPDKNVVITAGAGSGKTATLTEKVAYMIENGYIKPSELLVLTFTNNAAHEMKDRIIARFEDNKEYSKQILSTHVQTFDSFFQYLVSSYSGELGISDRLSIINADIINAKLNSALDDILLDEYANNKENSIKTLQKFNIRDDKKTKLLLLDLYHKLANMPVTKRDEYLYHYDELYLSLELFKEQLHEFLEEVREDIRNKLIRDNIYDIHSEEFDGEDLVKVHKLFTNPQVFIKDSDCLLFEDSEHTQKFYEIIRELLKLNDDEFIKALYNFKKDNAELLSLKKNKKNNISGGFRLMKAYFAMAEPKFGCVCGLEESIEEIHAKITYFKDDIHWHLNIVKRLFDEISSFKKVINSYDFNDIALMAYELVTNEKYEHVANEIRSRFKFIMVDEYQDTNDIQEEILVNLSKSDDCHVFCVGDAKQSIYKFRNANVKIISNRAVSYVNKVDADENTKSVTIPMNLNYRSGEPLLKDINEIFKYYMTPTHGSINFLSLDEQLGYDRDADLYGKQPYDHFGIYRLLPKPGNVIRDESRWEAIAILNDIKNKVGTFEVYDRKIGGLRKAKYSDFCILMRTKRLSADYQEVFTSYGIPLNVQLDTDLLQIDAIMVIQSIITLIGHYLLGIEVDIKHLFASIARSYLYEYSDDKLHKLLSSSINDIEKDLIIEDIKSFVDRNKETPFEQIFLNMINDFKVVEKLYKIGSSEDNITKIEMLQNIIVSQAKSGEGLHDFIGLLDLISKYSLNLGGGSSTSLEDAVDVMTIHASKGLEMKVVYMPNSVNKISSGNNTNKPDYTFSSKYGLILPYYNFDPTNVDEEGNPIPVDIYNVYDRMLWYQNSKNDEDVNEHVRYFYVALTRAENCVYIVGKDPSFKDIKDYQKEERLYGMMASTPHYMVIDPKIADLAISEGWVDKFDLDRFELLNFYYKQEPPLDKTSFENEKDYQNYLLVWNERFISPIRTEINEVYKHIASRITKGYIDKYVSLYLDDYDVLARIYAYSAFGEIVSGYDELERNVDSYLFKMDEKTRYYASFKRSFYTREKGQLKHFLERYFISLMKYDTDFFDLKVTQQLVKDLKDESLADCYVISDLSLSSLAFIFSEITQAFQVKFTYERFNENVEYFDITKVGERIERERVKILDLNINDEVIEFEEKKHLRASKVQPIDEEKLSNELLDFGTHLHRLLEMTNLKTKDTSFIKDSNDKSIIDSVLSNSLFNGLQSADVFKEYGYYDNDFNTTGYIDLFYIKDGEYYIIDYKSKNIDDEAYETQLHTYQRNIMSLFNVKDISKIHLYLLSIIDNRIKEVKPYSI